MKFKMRILHFSPAGNAEKIASAIARSQQANSDKIPPAYPCENEKLLFIGVEMKGSSVEKAVMDFCKDLNTSRTKNVAFFAVGSNFSGMDELKKLVLEKGISVQGDMFTCTPKGGLFKKAISEDDIKAAVAWSGKIVDSL